MLLVDDDPLVRSALKTIVEADEDLQIVGEASDGDEAASAARSHSPEVVLMDLLMERQNGIEATAAVRSLPDAPHVIALTTWGPEEAVVQMIEAGASGFLLKTASPREIRGAIRAVVDGDAVLSPRSTRQLLDRWRSMAPTPQENRAVATLSQLTVRERDIALAAAQGLTNDEIGANLFLSSATVKTHLSAIQAKLGVKNRVMVAVLVERAGWLR